MGDGAVDGVLELRWNRSAGEARSTPWVAQVALQFGLCRGELGQRTQEPIRVRLGGGRITAFVG
ncbi:MAG: hypothetical protein ACYSUI_05020, partial [Planctomycetota bacterium]